MTNDDLAYVIEALRACWAEISAMEASFEEYVVAGHLEEQVEQAIEILETALDE
jgi:hypothetical protein